MEEQREEKETETIILEYGPEARLEQHLSLKQAIS